MRILGRVARILAPGLVLFATLYLASEALDPVYPLLRARLRLVEEHAASYEGLSVGSSHARALDFEALGLKGLHFWTPGGDLFEAAFRLRQLLPRLNGVRCVFVVVSPHSPWFDNAVPSAADRRGIRRELYARSPSLSHLSGDANDLVLGKLAPVIRDDNWAGVVRTFVRGPRQVRVDRSGRSVQDPAALPTAGFADHGRARAEQHAARASEVEAFDPEVVDRAERALEGIVDFAASRGVGVVLYTPPYHRHYLETIDEGVLERTRALAGRAAARSPRAAYVDFSTDREMTGDVALFRDSDHLDRAGARIFSVRLGRELGRRPASAEGCLAGRSTAEPARRPVPERRPGLNARP